MTIIRDTWHDVIVSDSITDAELRRLVPDGAVVAVAGTGLNRKPMALLGALARSAVTGLSLVSFLGSLDVEVLIAAGAVAEVHTSGTALDGMGLAPRYRVARQSGTPRVVEWSEGSLAGGLEAGSLRLGSMPCGTSPRSEVVTVNPMLTVAPDPFTGEDTVYARAIVPDVGILQASAVDARGNLHVDGDPAVEALVAKASRFTIASVLAEEDRDPRRAAVSRIWVDRVVVDPRSAWPTACHPGPPADLDAVAAWVRTGGEDPAVLERNAP